MLLNFTSIIMKNTILIITTILVSFYGNAQKINNIKKCTSTPNIVPFIQNDLFGYYDIKAKKVVTQPKYAKAYPYQDDHYLAYMMGLQKDYEPVRYTKEEYATVTDEQGKSYRIDVNGKEIIQLKNKYDLTPKPLYSNLKYKIFQKNNLYGLQELKTGKEVIKNQFNEIDSMYEFGSENFQDIFIVRKGHQYGVINTDGKYLINMDYDYIENLTAGSDERFGILFLCRKDGKKTIIDLCGNTFEFWIKTVKWVKLYPSNRNYCILISKATEINFKVK